MTKTFKSYEEAMEAMFPNIWKEMQEKKEEERIKKMTPKGYAEHVIKTISK